MISHAGLAAYAQEAYDAEPGFLVANDAALIARRRGDETIIACRGTQPGSLANWRRDFDARPMRHFGIGYCHAGFSQGGVDLWALVAATITWRDNVVFTGHSLGGAMAQLLAACHNSDRQRKPCRVVTFGAPRVGSMRFGELVRRSSEAVEYQRAGDPVPDLPWPIYCWHPTRRRPIGRRFLDPLKNHSLANYRADLSARGA